jgi:hypothetical protein
MEEMTERYYERGEGREKGEGGKGEKNVVWARNLC